MLDIYNEQLALSGSYIAERRMNFLSSISADAAKIHSYISGGENIEISYSCGYKTEPDIYRGFLQSLNENREKDLRLGYTTAGPHRDDIKIVLNNADVRIYGSQGQQRTCALSLKLSELGYFRTVTGEYPILLLDDVFSELDENRKKRLTEYCSSTQTIITTTEKTGIGGVSFEVESGTIKRI
jgi:DNA replication and repair protein RecF